MKGINNKSRLFLRLISVLVLVSLCAASLFVSAGAEGIGFPAGVYRRSDNTTLTLIPVDKKNTIFTISFFDANGNTSYTVTGTAVGKLGSVTYDGKTVDIIFAASQKGITLKQDGTLKQSADGDYAFDASDYALSGEAALTLVSLLPSETTGFDSASETLSVADSLKDNAFYVVTSKKSGSTVKTYYVGRIGETVLTEQSGKLTLIYGYTEDLLALVENKLEVKEVKLGPSNVGFKLQISCPDLIKSMISVSYTSGNRSVAIVNKNGVVVPRGVGSTQLGIKLKLDTQTLTLATVVTVTE